MFTIKRVFFLIILVLVFTLPLGVMEFIFRRRVLEAKHRHIGKMRELVPYIMRWIETSHFGFLAGGLLVLLVPVLWVVTVITTFFVLLYATIKEEFKFRKYYRELEASKKDQPDPSDQEPEISIGVVPPPPEFPFKKLAKRWGVVKTPGVVGGAETEDED